MSFLIYQQDPNNENNTVELEIDYDMDYVLNDNGTLTDEIVSWAVIAINGEKTSSPDNDFWKKRIDPYFIHEEIMEDYH